MGRRDPLALIDAFRTDCIPYSQHDVAFNIVAKVVSENPSLVDKELIEGLFSFFSSAYFQKEVSLVANNNPEVFRDNFDVFINKAGHGVITDTHDLIEMTTNLLGEKFFQDEEVRKMFDGKYRGSTVKAMYECFSPETFDMYMTKYLEEVPPENVVHLVSQTTKNNEVLLVDYLPDLIEKCDVRDRKTLFEIALIASNTKAEDLEWCLEYLRREDLTNIIYEMLNKEVNLETVMMLGLSPEDLTDYQNKLASRIDTRVKAKLIKALDAIDEDIFPGNDDKELKLLDDKHYSEHFAKLKEVTDAYMSNDGSFFIPEDKKLIEYDMKNLVQILSGDDRTLKHKQLVNILEHEEIIKTQIGNKRFEVESLPLFLHANEYVPDEDNGLTSRATHFTKAENILTSLEEDVVDDFYESIGIDNKAFSTNRSLEGKDIRYGVEIEEIGVAETSFMDLDDYVAHGFNTTHECSLRKYRKDYEQSIPFGFEECGSEFISDIMSATSGEDLAKIKTQMDILKGERAKTNFSCGMHIHVSSPNTQFNTKSIAKKMTSEFKYVQDAVIDNFEVYRSRLSTHCKKIQSVEPEWCDRFKTVNMASLDRHGSIEFRFFNLPDALDMKVLESYIDFATCYYAYVESDETFHSSCVDFIRDNSDWLSDAPTELRSQAIFAKLCEDIEVKPDTLKVLGRLPEIFDFYTAIEPEHPERYQERNVSINEELRGLTKVEEEDSSEDIDAIVDEIKSYAASSEVDELFEDALYEIAESEIEDEAEEAKEEDKVLE